MSKCKPEHSTRVCTLRQRFMGLTQALDLLKGMDMVYCRRNFASVVYLPDEVPVSEKDFESPEAIERKRLWWHSRRGMLELDVLLLPFVENKYAELPPEDQAKYRKLLDCEDPDLFKWFMQHEEPSDPDHKYIVDMILGPAKKSS